MKRTKKGFTLVELLVVIAIIALLVSILMPSLGRAREMANRLKCSTQLRGMGNAIALYQNDYKGSNPINSGKMDHAKSGFGAAGTYEEAEGDWTSKQRAWFPGLLPENLPVLVGSSLYLLATYEDLVPKIFLCPSAEDAEEMDLQQAMDQNDKITDWSDLRDFRSMVNLSYSYNDPYNAPLDANSKSSLVVAADKNPKFSTETGESLDTSDDSPHPGAHGSSDPTSYQWDWTGGEATNRAGSENESHGNSKNHNTEMQNVLFVDTHVKKYANPLAGIARDNIYTYWSFVGPHHKLIGLWDTSGGPQNDNGQGSQDENDTYLGN